MDHHVLIVGGGFGGLWATRHLARAPVRITLVDRRNHHLFQPLLYQVATAGLSSPDIAAPLRHMLRRQRNAEVVLGDASSIDLAAHSVGLADGRTIGYDTLVVAAGSTHAYFGNDAWAEVAPGLKTLDDALEIRRRILIAFERAESASSEAERDGWLSFAIVGGGPTGVELAGTLAEIARHTLRDEFRRIDPSRARVRLVEAGPRILSSFPESLAANATRKLGRLGVEVVTGTPVSDITAAGYRLGESFVPARTVIWAAGVSASPLGRMLGAKTDRAGRVEVLDDLTVPGHPEVLVVGDLATLRDANGNTVPGVAPAAKQMGRHAARVVLARLRNEPAPRFGYRDYGNLATIGRMAAVVDLRGFHLTGVLAWWFWLVAHVFFLIGFRNRLTVLVNWAWSYWTYQRHARIIFERNTSPEK